MRIVFLVINCRASKDMSFQAFRLGDQKDIWTVNLVPAVPKVLLWINLWGPSLLVEIRSKLDQLTKTENKCSSNSSSWEHLWNEVLERCCKESYLILGFCDSDNIL